MPNHDVAGPFLILILVLNLKCIQNENFKKIKFIHQIVNFESTDTYSDTHSDADIEEREDND